MSEKDLHADVVGLGRFNEESIGMCSQSAVSPAVSAASSLVDWKNEEDEEDENVDTAVDEAFLQTGEETLKRVLSQLREEETCRQGYEEVLEDLHDGNLSYAEIGRRHDMHANQVRRIAQGVAALDGKGPGRRPLISESGEASIVLACKEMLAKGMLIHFAELRALALLEWRLMNPHNAQNPPKLGRHWFEGFRRRHEHLNLSATHVRMQDFRRYNALDRSQVNTACQHIKQAIWQNSSHPGNYIEASRLIFADETDVSMNAESAGTRGYNFGHAKFVPAPSAKGDLPHISVVPFVNLNADLLATVFIVEGNPSTIPELCKRPKHMIFNNSGGSEGDLPDGRKGSWRLALEILTKEIHQTFGSRENRPYLLFLDGLKAHAQISSKQFLKEMNIKTVILDPNLTQVIQLQDTEYIFGFLKGALRRAALASNSVLGGVRPTLEMHCNEVEKVVNYAHSSNKVRSAAESIGFRFKEENGVLLVTMTDDSISTFLNRLERSGLIRGVSGEVTDHHELRNAEFLRARHYYKEHPEETPTTVFAQSEAQYLKLHAEQQEIINARLGSPPSKRPRRSGVKASEDQRRDNRPGTILLNSEDVLATVEARAAKARKQREKEANEKKLRSTASHEPKKTTETAKATNLDSPLREQLFFNLWNPASL